MNDIQRAAIIATIQSVFPVLLILGVVDLTEEEIGAIMLFVSNALTMVMLIVKNGQQAGPA